MSQDAALLQQILSEKIGTDGLIQMGTTQPYDLIRLYENPANATKLTNIGTDGLTTASTTVLVIDEGTARTGLTFEPDLSLLKHTGSDVKLLVSASVEQAVNVVLNHAGHTTTQLVTAPADKTAVLTIGLIAGIATVIGSHNFFDEAAAGEGSGSGTALTVINGSYTNGLLTYTGGEFQAGSGVSGAGLHADGLHDVTFVVPDMTQSQMVVLAVYADELPDFSGVGSAVKLGLIMMSQTTALMSIEFGSRSEAPIPVALGDTVVVSLSASTMSVAVNGVTHTAAHSLDAPLSASAKTHVAAIGIAELHVTVS